MIDYDRLNPPALEVRVFNGEPYEKMNTDLKWLRVGYIPTPTTRLGWFVYNMAHGIAMRYPFWQVVKFSLSQGSDSGFSVAVEADEAVWKYFEYQGCGTLSDEQSAP